MSHQKTKFILVAVLSLLLLSLFSGCSPHNELDRQIRKATNNYRFRLLNWEIKTIAGEVWEALPGQQTSTDNTTFREKIIERQIREAYSEQGLYNPLDRFVKSRVSFPPVNIYLAKPPHLLVVSPRDRIESIREITLLPDMDADAMNAIEAQIDSLGYSALIVNLGGLATFPSYVSDDADTKYILKTAAEEWLHQYLAFTPLGFLYVLDVAGIHRNYDIATMNETVVGIVSDEIANIAYEKYYAPPETNTTVPETTVTGFDFNQAMREIRQTVDAYLTEGEIEAAETYMEQQRQYLAENCYHIRKLNQAYFAYHGTYASSLTSISPIGVDFKKLRSESASLREFLIKASTMTSRQELTASVE